MVANLGDLALQDVTSEDNHEEILGRRSSATEGGINRLVVNDTIAARCTVYGTNE